MDEQTYQVIEKIIVLKDVIEKHIVSSDQIAKNSQDILHITTILLKDIKEIQVKLFDHINKEEATLELTADVLNAFKKTRQVVIWIGSIVGGLSAIYGGYISIIHFITN